MTCKFHPVFVYALFMDSNKECVNYSGIVFVKKKKNVGYFPLTELAQSFFCCYPFLHFSSPFTPFGLEPPRLKLLLGDAGR